MAFTDWLLYVLQPIPGNCEEWKKRGPIASFVGYNFMRIIFSIVIVLNFLYALEVDTHFNFLPVYQVVFLAYFFFLISQGFHFLDFVCVMVDQIPFWIRMTAFDTRDKVIASFGTIANTVCWLAVWYYSFKYQKYHHQHEHKVVVNFDPEDEKSVLVKKEEETRFPIKEKWFLMITAYSYLLFYLIKYWGTEIHGDNMQAVITETYYDIVICVYIVYAIRDATKRKVVNLGGFPLIACAIWIIAFIFTVLLKIYPPAGLQRTLFLAYNIANNILFAIYLFLAQREFSFSAERTS